jgi:hypothetical protein
MYRHNMYLDGIRSTDRRVMGRTKYGQNRSHIFPYNYMTSIIIQATTTYQITHSFFSHVPVCSNVTHLLLKMESSAFCVL